MGGFDVLAQMRLVHSVPVIMVTGRDGETDRVLGLELGADDYVVKPFSPRELTSRVRAILRRSSPASDEEHLDFVGLHIDLTSREVRVEGRAVGSDDAGVRTARCSSQRRRGGCTHVRNSSNACGRRRWNGRIRQRSPSTCVGSG